MPEVKVLEDWPEDGEAWLQGHVNVSYSRLIEEFGEPVEEAGDGYKVDAEWLLNVDGFFATIYNFKDGKNYLGEEGIPTEEITHWHIGGSDLRIVPLVKEVLGDRSL